jgi:hypothetical protein
MPKKEINYEKAIIYKFVCNDLTIKEVYIGSTTNFCVRKNSHKYDCSNPNSKHHNLKIYQFIRENGGWENWSMIEIEKPVCNDANELRKRERFWIEELNATLNFELPSRSMKELQQTEKYVEYRKNWCEENKKKQKEYHRLLYLEKKKNPEFMEMRRQKNKEQRDKKKSIEIL